jgi:hypothetical protein
MTGSRVIRGVIGSGFGPKGLENVACGEGLRASFRHVEVRLVVADLHSLCALHAPSPLTGFLSPVSQICQSTHLNSASPSGYPRMKRLIALEGYFTGTYGTAHRDPATGGERSRRADKRNMIPRDTGEPQSHQRQETSVERIATI